MNTPKFADLPEHKKGGKHNTESHRCFEHQHIALQKYKAVRKRFLNINYWHEYANGLGASFSLCDHNGTLLEGEPKQGDYIKIDIPGPGNRSGNSDDWVKIEYWNTSELANTMRCRPCENPTKESDYSVAHFYASCATSTFTVFCQSRCVIVGIYGRNEVPNNQNVQFLDKLRNTYIALGGIFGASKIQWKLLTESLLED